MKNLLPLAADLANGIFAVALASYTFSVEPAWWHFLIGILCAFLPDIDAIPELWRRGRVSASASDSGDHRVFLHYPLLTVLLMVPLVWLFGYWGAVLALAVGLHLINDFYGTGWGVQLFWPFSKRHYKLLGRRANRQQSILAQDGDWEHLSEAERRLRLVVSWSEEELPEYIQRWGVDLWIGPYYMRINWISGVEYTLFLVAVALLVYLLV